MKKLIKQQSGRGWNREIMTKIEKTVNLTLNVGDAVLESVAFTEWTLYGVGVAQFLCRMYPGI